MPSNALALIYRALYFKASKLRFVLVLVKKSPKNEITSASSVARGGGGGGAIASPLAYQLNAEWEKHYVFSTSETVFSTGVD